MKTNDTRRENHGREKKLAHRAAPIPEEKIKHRYAADVVIVGAGHAGTCAARAASEVPETSVIVLEQQDVDDIRFFGGGEKRSPFLVFYPSTVKSTV